MPQARPAALSRGGSAIFRLAVLLLMPGLLEAAWYSETVARMGTRVEVAVWHEDESDAKRAITAAVAEIGRIERLMSTYIDSSQISQLNREAAQRAVVTDSELFGLIERSTRLSALSDGAFDISYESVGRHYEFREGRRPDSRTVASELPRVDYRLIALDRDRRTVRFLKQGVRINLGGIAKGYAVECAARELGAHGVRSAIVTAGGDTRLLGSRNGAPWIVGIRNPRDADDVAVRLPLADEAVSTSGDYERYFEQGGERFHHILSPTTGYPARGVRSATVVGPDGVMTDGLSTALFVLGVDAGLALIESLPDYEAVFVDRRQKLHFSSGLAPPAGP